MKRSHQSKTPAAKPASGRTAFVAASLAAIAGVAGVGLGTASIFASFPLNSSEALGLNGVQGNHQLSSNSLMLPEQNRVLGLGSGQSRLLPPIVPVDVILQSQVRPEISSLPDAPPRPSFSEPEQPRETPLPTPTDTEPGLPVLELSPDSFLFAGDSISVGLHEVMAAPPANLYGRIGASSKAIIDKIIPLMREGKFTQRHIVIALGTNDSLGMESQFSENVGRFIAEADNESKCVVWLTIHRIQNGNSWEPFNEKLREASARNEHLKLVDWANLAKSRPEYLYQDGIHIKPEGYKAIWKLIQAEAQTCPTR